jgi:hypothetical protein
VSEPSSPAKKDVSSTAEVNSIKRLQFHGTPGQVE